jgi:hypothetical protein
LSIKEQKMSLDKFKEHIAQDDEVKSEEVVAEEAKTDEEFAEVVEAEEATTEVVEAKKQTKESEDEVSDEDEEEDEVAEAKKVSEEEDEDSEEDEEEVAESADEDEEEEMDETADMTKTQLQASAMKMIKAMKKDELQAGYKAMKASYDPAKKEVGVNTPEEVQTDAPAIAEDVEVMFAGSDLSEDFKAKAQTIFEAAVSAKAAEQIAEVEVAKEAAITEGVEAVKVELTEKVDSYLDYVVEQWMKDNEIAIEKGLKAELVEDFLGGLKNLFMEHYIDVPEEKVDVLDEQATEIEELKAKLNEQIEQAVEQKKVLDQFVAQKVLSTVSEGLADTEAEKVAKLAEGIDFVDADQYREKLETIKESYFPKTKATGGNPEDNVSEVSIETDGAMAAYAQALSRMKKG